MDCSWIFRAPGSSTRLARKHHLRQSGSASSVVTNAHTNVAVKKLNGKAMSKSCLAGGQLHVKIVDVPHHFFDGEIFARKIPARLAKSLAERRVAGQLQ